MDTCLINRSGDGNGPIRATKQIQLKSQFLGQERLRQKDEALSDARSIGIGITKVRYRGSSIKVRPDLSTDIKSAFEVRQSSGSD